MKGTAARGSRSLCAEASMGTCVRRIGYRGHPGQQVRSDQQHQQPWHVLPHAGVPATHAERYAGVGGDAVLTFRNTAWSSGALSRAAARLAAGGYGRIITMSPPIRLDVLAGHTAYYMSKFGMTLVALGAAAEFRGTGVTANSLWPATVIESLGAYARCVLHRAATRIQLVHPPPLPWPVLTRCPRAGT